MLCDFEPISELDYKCIRPGCCRVVRYVKTHELPIKAPCNAPRGLGDWLALYIQRFIGIIAGKTCGCEKRQRTLNRFGWWVTDTISSAIRNP